MVEFVTGDEVSGSELPPAGSLSEEVPPLLEEKAESPMEEMSLA